MADQNDNQVSSRGNAPARSYRPPHCVEPSSQGVHYPGMHYQLYMSAIQASPARLPQASPPRRERRAILFVWIGVLCVTAGLALGLASGGGEEIAGARTAVLRHFDSRAETQEENTAITGGALPLSAPTLHNALPEATHAALPAVTEPAVRLFSTASIGDMPAAAAAVPVGEPPVPAHQARPDGRPADAVAPACSDALRAMQLCGVALR